MGSRSSAQTPIRCASCAADLEPCRTAHGVVWVCRACEAGATTLGVLRHVAPRAFVNQLWQAARRFGLPGAKRCPSCAQPLLALDAARVELSPALLVCCNCFVVWLERPSLHALRLAYPRLRSAVREAGALAEAHALGDPTRVEREARTSLLLAWAAARGAAEVIESVLGSQP